MKHGSTLFLRGTIITLGLIVLVLCVLVLPVAWRSDNTAYYRPLVVGMYLAAIPFYYAVYQAFKLLGHIDRNDAFSQSSVTILNHIRYCAVGIAGLYVAGLPYAYFAHPKNDAMAVIIDAIIVLASLVFAVFAAVLQRLLQDALDIKSENDLTV